jgi:dTDP-4-dehydrorhamnose 3,5-epimerase
MSGLAIEPLPLSGLCLVTRRIHGDDRGSFARLWSADALTEHGFPTGPVQVNHSITHTRGTIRGLHYQRPPHMETRLVSCIRGEIFDVAVDLRPDSPTFGRWHAEHLSPENGRGLLIPEGFAHGFQTLTDDCEIVYCHSQPYAAEAETGVAFDDPALAIAWPLPPTVLSDRDRSLAPLAAAAPARRCRHCRWELSRLLIDLGRQPSSNDYLTADRLSAPEKILPLKAYVCDRCWLVQVEDHQSREALFSHDYAYFSSTSFTWARHAAAYTTMIVERLGLTRDHFVLEIASNDGYLLRNFVALGIPCLGIEPTASTAAAAEAAGVPTRREFFGESLGRSLAADGRQADLVIGNNVFAHVPDINDFARGLAAVLAPGGTITLEFPSLQTLLEKTLFDTIYHEHFSYLSLSAADRILRSAGLRACDVEAYATHGGSLRVYACHADDPRPTSPRVAAMLAAERAAGLQSPVAYAGFQQRVGAISDELLAFLEGEKAAGRRVAAYGAAAKGNTLLNFAGITPELLPYVCDAAPSKQGLFLPGSRIPIHAPEHLAADRPDTVLILAWNLAGEIKQQLAPRLPAGTRYVVAVPRMADV